MLLDGSVRVFFAFCFVVIFRRQSLPLSLARPGSQVVLDFTAVYLACLCLSSAGILAIIWVWSFILCVFHQGYWGLALVLC